MITRTTLGLIACVLAGVFCGCAQLGEATGMDLDHPSSTELRSVQFYDIPVPYGFSLVDRFNESLTHEQPGLRVGRLTYRGVSVPLEELTTFYRKQMQLQANGWKFVGESELGFGKGHLMEFTKNPFVCAITVTMDKTYTDILVKVDTKYGF